MRVYMCERMWTRPKPCPGHARKCVCVQECRCRGAVLPSQCVCASGRVRRQDMCAYKCPIHVCGKCCTACVVRACVRVGVLRVDVRACGRASVQHGVRLRLLCNWWRVCARMAMATASKCVRVHGCSCSACMGAVADVLCICVIGKCCSA